MTLPTDRLSVWINPQGTPADPNPDPGFPDGGWTDVTEFFRVLETVQIKIGSSNEGNDVEPSNLTIRLDNTDGRFSPHNPESPYYPDLGLNTPMLVAWDMDGLGNLVSLANGFVSEWPPRWDLSGRADVTVPIEANGVLRRLGQGQPLIKSAIYREIVKSSRPDPVQYWTCQDPAGGTRLASAIADAPAMIITGEPDLASFDEWVASEPLPTMNGARYVGPIPAYEQTGEVLIRCFFNVPSDGAADGTQLIGFPSSGQAARWAVFYETGGVLRLRVSDIDGNLLEDSPVAFDVDGHQFSFSLEITRDGLDLDWLMLVVKILPDGTTSAGQVTGTITGVTLGHVQNLAINFNRLGDDIAFGHIVFATDTTIFAGTESALVAWQGEPAGDRVLRLSEEEDIFIDVIGAVEDEILMGPQRAKTALELLRECEHADRGTLYERPDSFGLSYRNRGNLYNQTPAMELTDLQLGAAPEPTDDDQQIANDITVSSEIGFSARASDHDHITRFGRYESESTLNIAARESLFQVASHLLALGTVTQMRWPSIVLQLAATPELIDTWLAVRQLLAERVTVSHTIAQLPGTDIDVLILGWTETIDEATWTVELNCAPAGPWNVATVATDVDPGVSPNPYQRAGTAGSRLAAQIDDTETTISVDTTAGPVWVTDPDEMPIDIDVGGEEMTVTSITGATSPQTFEVVRSVNGVHKAHAAFDTVKLAYPAIVSL